MYRPRRARSFSGLLSILALLGCTDRPTEPPPFGAPAPSLAILDAAHGGSSGLYFLPPIVPAPTYSGTFDATQSPVVTICALVGGSCGATVATFSGSQIKVDLEAQSYGVNWKTRDAGLDPSTTYRIQVTEGTSVIGYADVVVVANGSQVKTVEQGGFVAVHNGGTLPIRFRIETATPPPPPPPAGTWETGDLITYNQDSWGTLGSTAASLLFAYFFALYPNGVEIGIPGAGGNSAIFNVVESVMDFLPMSGTPAPLDNDYQDPASTDAGYFAGYVLALRLDVNFTDGGYLAGTSSLRFGDLRVCGLSATPSFNGLTVRQALAALEQLLGGATTTFDYEQLATLAKDLTESFESGVPSQWAQDHLVNGSCP
jgi:hypothetical protein